MANIRPTATRCEVCGRPVEVAAKGRIAHMHRECGTMINDFERFERAVEAVADGMTDDELRALRKLLCSRFFNFTNGRFNAVKRNRKVAEVAP